MHKYAAEVCRNARGSLDVTKQGFVTFKPLVYDGQSGRAAETCIYTEFLHDYAKMRRKDMQSDAEGWVEGRACDNCDSYFSALLTLFTSISIYTYI